MKPYKWTKEDRAVWRRTNAPLLRQHRRHDDSWFWVNVLIVLALYWLAHCV